MITKYLTLIVAAAALMVFAGCNRDEPETGTTTGATTTDVTPAPGTADVSEPTVQTTNDTGAVAGDSVTNTRAATSDAPENTAAGSSPNVTVTTTQPLTSQQ